MKFTIALIATFLISGFVHAADCGISNLWSSTGKVTTITYDVKSSSVVVTVDASVDGKTNSLGWSELHLELSTADDKEKNILQLVQTALSTNSSINLIGQTRYGCLGATTVAYISAADLRTIAISNTK